jgi:hypothetical protein
MNNWMWIVILIPVVIWILSTVIRPPEEQPRRGFPPGGEEPAEPRRGRPPGEVERFLEEINRLRRRASEEQRPSEAPAARPEVPRPVPRRVVRPNVPRPRPQPVSRPLEAAPLGKIPVPASVPPPPPPPPPAPAAPVGVSGEVLDVIPVSRAPVLTSLPAATAGLSPAATAIRDMFRNPQTLAAAIVLHEVLGPPKCRRRRV